MISTNRVVVMMWLALLGWQPIWLLLLPHPAGPRNAALAVFATLPLLIPLPGMLRGRMRSMTWGGFIAVPYFIVGVTEAWSNPPMRAAALLETLLALGYVVALVHHVKRLGSRAGS